MALGPEVKRWAKDLASNDPETRVRPDRALAMVEAALPRLNKEERQKNLEQLKAHTEVYYKGHHNVDVPKEIAGRLEQVEKRIVRLNEVDSARAVMARYGGPPTAKTIQDSLARSAASLQMGKAEGKTETVPPPTAQRSAASSEQKLRAHAVNLAQVIAGTPQKEKSRSAGAQMDMGM